MSETLPRFGLPELNFLTVDTETNKQRVISAYESITGRSLAAGDPVRLFLLALAAENTALRQAFNLGARQNLLTYATGDFLDALGAMVDTPRLAADSARVTLTFTLNTALAETYVIPAGTQVTDGNYIFAVDANTEIAAGETAVDTPATCITAGAAPDEIAAGALKIMVDPLPNIESVTNAEAPSGGADAELDKDYAERIRLAPSRFSVAGPNGAYVYHAKSYSSAIIDVSVYGLPEHPGNVYVHPLLTGGELPNEAFLDGLKAYLSGDTIRPLTDNLIVTAPEEVTYQLELTWYLSAEDSARVSQITSQVAEAVETYRLWQQARIGRDLNPDHLIELLRLAGVKRAVITSPVFTVIAPAQVARCSGLNVTYGGSEEG